MFARERQPMLDRSVPKGTPRLASWWWRALLAGGTIGLVPLLVVLWHFGDQPVGAAVQAVCPGAIRWFGALLSATGWVIAVAMIGVWRTSTDAPGGTGDTWLILACMAVAGLVCALFDAFGAVAGWMLAHDRAAWSCLSPSAVCAVTVALATAHWARVSSLRWPCTLVAALVMVAEVGDGVAWASDALAGAWIGFATALAVPWAWWMRQRSLDVEAAPPSTVRP